MVGGRDEHERRRTPLIRALAWFAGARLLLLVPLAVGAGLSDRSLHVVLTRWDSQWYRWIAREGYGTVVRHPDGRLLSDYAFFPLYPMTERGLHVTTGLSYVDAGLLVSIVASFAAAIGIYLLADHLWDERVATAAVVTWALLPVAGVQWMAYTESLFTALIAGALLCAVRERWILAGVLAGLASATRPTGLAVAAAVGVAALWKLIGAQQRGQVSADLVARTVAAAVLAPSGAVAYLLWVGGRTGGLDGYLRVTAGWHNGLDGGVAFVRWTWHLLTTAPYVPGLLVLAGVALLVYGVGCVVRQRQPLPLVVFTVALVGFALTTSGYFGSKPRYLLPAFTLLYPFAAWVAHRTPRTRMAIGVVAAVLSTGYGTVWLLGSGPP